MKNTSNNLRRLVAILTITILTLAWGLAGLSFLLEADADLQGVTLTAAILATPVVLVLCGLAFGKVRVDNSPDEDDDYGFSNQYGVLSQNRRNFRHPSSSPATSASRSIILPSLWKV
jgi:hypothetical protein